MTTILDGDQPRLFSADDLTNWLSRPVPVTDAKVVVVEQVVWGWLKPAMGATVRPQPVPAEVFSWAIELGGIAHENPSGLTSEQLGPSQRQFSAERRGEILAEVRGASRSGGPRPRGSFPSAPCYPDPARR